MNIQNVGLKFTNETGKRSITTAIVLHHAEANGCTVKDIHQWHLNNGWAGIGYHFYVRKDGTIYQGRPIDWIGAHAGSSSGYNKISIGICFEGRYNSVDKSMPTAQLNAGKELVAYCKQKYPSIKEIKKHSECTATDCPGKYFPFDNIAKGKETINMSTFKKGDSNNAVFACKLLLLQLKREGIITQGVDANGVFGAGTEIAVKQVQKKAGLKHDGIIDTDTLKAMNTLLETAEKNDAKIQKERDTLKKKIANAQSALK